jgi:hypothetical protein
MQNYRILLELKLELYRNKFSRTTRMQMRKEPESECPPLKLTIHRAHSRPVGRIEKESCPTQKVQARGPSHGHLERKVKTPFSDY